MGAYFPTVFLIMTEAKYRYINTTNTDSEIYTSVNGQFSNLVIETIAFFKYFSLLAPNKMIFILPILELKCTLGL